jgi:hypothetical protein
MSPPERAGVIAPPPLIDEYRRYQARVRRWL